MYIHLTVLIASPECNRILEGGNFGVITALHWLDEGRVIMGDLQLLTLDLYRHASKYPHMGYLALGSPSLMWVEFSLHFNTGLGANTGSFLFILSFSSTTPILYRYISTVFLVFSI